MPWRRFCTLMSSPDQAVAPVTLASSLLSYFASHLVILTLLLFLVVGLRLAGVWGGEPQSLGSSSAADVREGQAGLSTGGAEISPQSVPESETRQSTDARLSDDVDRKETTKPETRAKDRPQPRLIGGSLPMYGVGGESGGSGTESFPVPADGFRPEVFTPQAQPQPGFERSREDLIQDARRAFWNGDFEGAEVAYMTILTLHPGDADTFGELGNLYQSMGKRQQAIDAYYEAAIRLKAEGDEKKLNKIISLLEESDDPRAALLRP